MSVLPLKANIRQRIEHVCFAPLADTALVFGVRVEQAPRQVRVGFSEVGATVWRVDGLTS